MRFGVGLKWVGIAALVLGASTATAQGGAGGSAQVGFQQSPRLSPQDEVSQGELVYSKIEHTSAVIRKQLDTARQARDVVKSLCLSDKLSQVDVAGRSVKDRQTALLAAVQRADAELANHEFTIISVLGTRVTQLMAEANQCIGEEVAFVGQTEVIATVEPMPGGPDVTGYPQLPPVNVTYPPPCTSCTGNSF
jgi:hypothetical protein